MDFDHNGRVAVNELVAAVRAALIGCGWIENESQ